MKNLLAIIGFALLVTSCTFYEPEFRGGESIKVEQIDGRDIKLRAGGKVYNGNGYAIKVKPSTLDVYIDDEYLGKVHLDKKVKMKAKQETLIDAPLTATLAEGAMFRAMRLAGQKNVTVRLKGKVRAGVWFLGKKIDVNESRTLDGLQLNLGQ